MHELHFLILIYYKTIEQTFLYDTASIPFSHTVELRGVKIADLNRTFYLKDNFFYLIVFDEKLHDVW